MPQPKHLDVRLEVGHLPLLRLALLERAPGFGVRVRVRVRVRV